MVFRAVALQDVVVGTGFDVGAGIEDIEVVGPVGMAADGNLLVGGVVLNAAERLERAVGGVDLDLLGADDVLAGDTEVVVEVLELRAAVEAVEKVVFGDEAAIDNVARRGGVDGGWWRRDSGKLQAHYQHGSNG